MPFDINNPPNCALFDGVAGQPLFDISAEFDSEQTDYRVALDYHFTEDFMTYGQVATGYKGGGVNPRPFFIVQIETFEPEEMETYEVGFKSTLFDDRMRLNVAVFFNDYSDIVLEQLACELPFPPFFGPGLACSRATSVRPTSRAPSSKPRSGSVAASRSTDRSAISTSSTRTSTRPPRA